MDNAISTPKALPASAAADTPGFGARLAQLPLKPLLMVLLGGLGLIAIAVAMAMQSRQGSDWKVLFAGLPDKEAAAIVAQLSQQNVPYRVSEPGGSLLVPGDKVHELRLRLASQGLPKSGGVGFELMDNARFGQTQFQERVSYQRAVEGELVRSIASMSAVQSARVHLALPNQNGFFREQQKPSASVVVLLHPGRSLEKQQVAGIVHLVAAAVPEMQAKNISVLDGNGSLLTESEDSSSGLDARQLQYVRDVESGYEKRIAALLEPVIGRENLRATVTAEVDFAQSESTSEEFRPNQGAEATVAIRSQQTSEQTNGGTGAPPSGVPGATSNQPPTPATAPVTGAAAPLQAAQNNGAGGSGRREATTNYEVDKTVRVTRAATGSVKRLSAAVVVNHRQNTDARGRVSSAPLSEQDLQKITALVEQGIGLNKERGDSVRVVNTEFKKDPVAEVAAPPIWQQPWLMDMLRAWAAPAGLGLVALLLVATLLRPGLKELQAAAPRPEPLVSTVVDEVPALPGPEVPALEAPAVNAKLEKARRLARENPAAMANVLRSMAGGTEKSAG
jgi:flagellar M-ring protein FliF